MMHAQNPDFCRHQAREYSAATQTKVSQTASEAVHRLCKADTRATFESANSRCISAAELSPPAAKTHDRSMVAPAVGRSPRSSGNMLPARRQWVPPAAAVPLVALLALALLAGSAVAAAAASGLLAAAPLSPAAAPCPGATLTKVAASAAWQTLLPTADSVLSIAALCHTCCSWYCGSAVLALHVAASIQRAVQPAPQPQECRHVAWS